MGAVQPHSESLSRHGHPAANNKHSASRAGPPHAYHPPSETVSLAPQSCKTPAANQNAPLPMVHSLVVSAFHPSLHCGSSWYPQLGLGNQSLPRCVQTRRGKCPLGVVRSSVVRLTCCCTPKRGVRHPFARAQPRLISDILLTTTRLPQLLTKRRIRICSCLRHRTHNHSTQIAWVWSNLHFA